MFHANASLDILYEALDVKPPADWLRAA
jgi:hypothetical protein